MSQLTITNSFTAGTLIQSAQVNTNFTDISTIWNAHDAGTDAWQNVVVTATAANPVQISSNQSTTEVSINNTATDGDPILSFELGGTAAFTVGVDDGDGDKFKIGTTAIGTSTSITISGTEVTFPGTTITTGVATFSEAAEFKLGADDDLAIRFTSDTNTGIWANNDSINIVTNGSKKIAADASVIYVYGQFQPNADDSYPCGVVGARWSDVRSVLINGSDYGFANGYILREFPATHDDVKQKDEAWMKENANVGIQVINDLGETVAVIGRDGTIYAKAFAPLTDLPDYSEMENAEKKRKSNKKKK